MYTGIHYFVVLEMFSTKVEVRNTDRLQILKN